MRCTRSPSSRSPGSARSTCPCPRRCSRPGRAARPRPGTGSPSAPRSRDGSRRTRATTWSWSTASRRSESAQTVVIPSWDTDRRSRRDELLDAVRAAHARGARVVALCLGSFVVAAAGLVDGREVATHWSAAAELARRTPAATVRSDVLWCDLGDVVTSAGVAAALDCCLHVVRTDHGAAYAADLARSLVLAPHRDGSQAQYIPAPVAPQRRRRPRRVGDRVGDGPARPAARPGHLGGERAPVAPHVHAPVPGPDRHEPRAVAPAATAGARPGAARVHATSRSSTSPSASGFGSSAALRQHFAREFRTSPRRHRAAFRS